MMTDAKDRRPANTVDRSLFRGMCVRFAKMEAAPRWERADDEKSFPRDF